LPPAASITSQIRSANAGATTQMRSFVNKSNGFTNNFPGMVIAE
jgi:hypothetical protein